MRRFLPLMLATLTLGACSAHHAPLPADNDRTYVVFFQPVSTALDDAANKTISQAVTYARHFPQKQIYVEGYAAVYGDLSQDEMLAIQRAKIVTQQVIQDGIPADRVHDTPRAPEDRKNQVAARRVEIQIR